MKIGTFTKNDDGVFQGRIQTLTFQADIQFLPVNDKTKDTVPDFRIISTDGEIEIGAGWFKKARSGKAYISCKIDDPIFPSPLLMSDGDSYNLYWDHPSPTTKPETGEKETF